MATIADFRLPAAAFPLGAAIEADPGIRIELERVVPTDEGILPFFWVWGCDDLESFERCVFETEAVDALESVSGAEDGRLYRARWNGSVEGFLRGVGRLGVTVLEGRGTRDGWRFELRFSDHGSIRTFQAYCRDAGVPVSLNRLYTPREERAGEQYQLTEEQRETIRLAHRRGYFEEPQRVTQSDLAEELGVSQRAVSRRLRRGLSRLVGHTVSTDSDPVAETD
ncbi:helix-turn-helix domain-containing protein [Natrialbaceae archaeon GCM10025810]|uniref:helix-turn-helix domain-containing protein n=1 Tax=Halovalidus salilacus TaxID=3075124 RepID=UPI00361220AE